MRLATPKPTFGSMAATPAAAAVPSTAAPVLSKRPRTPKPTFGTMGQPATPPPTPGPQPNPAAATAAAQAALLSNQTVPQYGVDHGVSIQDRLKNTPKPGAAVPTTPPNYWDEAETEHDSLMSEMESDWGKQQGTLQNEMAGFQRAADSTNARMGGSIAGGSAGLAGAALGQGMEAYNSAAMEYNNRRRATQLSWLDQRIEEGRRQQEYDWDQQNRTEDWEHQLVEMALANDIPLEDIQGLMGGTGSAADILKARDDKNKANEAQEKELGQIPDMVRDTYAQQGIDEADMMDTYTQSIIASLPPGQYMAMQSMGMSDEEIVAWMGSKDQERGHDKGNDDGLWRLW